jgi:hypothetical protein
VRSYVGVDLSENLVRLGQKRMDQAGLQGRASLIVSDCLD